MFSLQNKVALVGGSTQGIGWAAAQLLAKAGSKVVLLARNEEKLKQCLAELPRPYAQTHAYIVADFAQPQQVKAALSQYQQENPEESIHILVNNTGGPPAGKAIEASLDAFREAFEAHLIVNQILTQQLVEGMKKEKFGRIINVISTSVKQPLDNLGVSNTIRAAVASWAKTLSKELATFGITVNNVLPGATATQRLDTLITNKSKKQQVPYEVIEAEMKAEVPAQRFATPEEIGAAILFLATEEAAYINGINLPVDGGRLSTL
ncbi:MAG: SDR family oxidoreductase [Cytophagales bacterium]|nr:MAG: SDR family oxidoreductase [Cytophagales bacterium]